MPITNRSSENPTSTASAFGPGTRGPTAASDAYIFTGVAAGSTAVLPAIENYPAVFAIASTGASNQVCAIYVVTAANAGVVLSGSNFSTTPGANVIVPSIASGVVTLTPNATTFTSRTVTVTRIS